MSIVVSCSDDQIFLFDPKSTALFVIDMQRDFIFPDGDDKNYPAEGGPAPLQKVVPKVKSVLEAARMAGLFIVHTREGHESDLSTLHPLRRLPSCLVGAEIGAPGPMGRILVRGEYGHDFVDGLHPQKGELVIDKQGFDSFYKTNLEAELNKRGITHMIVCGVTTECCIQSTIRGAVDRGYFTLLIGDCCASYHAYMHEMTLSMFPAQGNLFGWVCEVDALMPKLKSLSATIAAS